MNLMGCSDHDHHINDKENTKLNESASWLPGLFSFLQEQASVEAVKFDPQKRSIAVATLGKVDEEELEQHLSNTLVNIQEKIVHQKTQDKFCIPPVFRVEDKGGITLLQKPSCMTAPHLWIWREMPWPSVEEKEPLIPEWLFLAILSGLCATFGIIGVVLQKFSMNGAVNPRVSILFFCLAIIAGGWDAAMSVWQKLFKKELDIHFLMLAVAVGAACIGAWEEAAILLFLFSFAEALEHYAMDRTKKSIDALFKSAPKEALLITAEGIEKRTPIDLIVPNQLLRVRPGDLFPVDGVVVEGETAADESNLTGESLPIDKNKGDLVYAGTVNLWGSVKVGVLKPAQESSLQKVIRLIQEAQNLKAPSQRFTERFGTHYTVGIFLTTVVMFLVWWLGFGIPAFANTGAYGYSSFYRAMTLLVVASPCALVISIPSAILAAIAWGARHGILFRGGIALEKLHQVNYVALDKTGTLTTGDLSVESVESFPPGRENEIAMLAYSLEKNANHPLARAIVAYGRKRDFVAKAVERFQSLTGLGVQGEVDGKMCVLGRRQLLTQGSLSPWIQNVPEPTAEFSEVWVMQKNLIGRILLKDQIRLESKSVLEALKKRGLRTVMLTGDRKEVAKVVGEEIGIEEIRAELKPEDKVKIVHEAGLQGYKVAMVGDGINDAPSLAAAYVSVAMGARGSDAALEQSEVVLMQDKIDNFLQAYDLSQRAKTIIRQNLTISLGVIIIMVLSSVAGIVPLTLGVIAHEGSTLIVCLNSLRLLFKRKSE